MNVYELKWQSAAKNVDADLRHAQDLAAKVADDEGQSYEVREIFSALYSALREARTQSFNAQVALGLQEADDHGGHDRYVEGCNGCRLRSIALAEA